MLSHNFSGNSYNVTKLNIRFWQRLLLTVVTMVAMLGISGPAQLTFGYNGQTVTQTQANPTSQFDKPKSEIAKNIQPRATSLFTYAWGYNTDGELGNNSSTDSSVPVTVSLPTGITGFTAFAAGDDHSLGLGSDGKLYAWGDNTYDQLGNSSIYRRSYVPVPVTLPAGVTGFTAIAAGDKHSLALGNDGKLYGWGLNSYGELGNNTTTNSEVPVPVTLPAGVTRFIAFAAGDLHSLGLGNDGKLYAWGSNLYGQLGINSTIKNSIVPVPVTLPAGVTRFTAMTAGIFHSLALGNDGKLYSWGYNPDGELGNNDTTDSSIPVPVTLPAGVTSFSAFATGGYHSLALGNDGKLYAWGRNNEGELGNNSTINSRVPVPVSLPAGVTSFTTIAIGAFHSLGLGNDGKLYAWGNNRYGQLGNNSTTDSNVPVPVSLPAGVIVRSFATGSSASQNFITVATPTTILTSTPNPAQVGQSVTFTATVTSASATGTVVFTNTTTGTTLGSATLNGSGVATITTSFPTAGNYNIKASYSGDSSFGPSISSGLIQTVSTSAVPPFTYFLPLVANKGDTLFGQATTFVTFQNLSTSATANITVQYYGFGTGVPINSDSLTLPAKGQKAILPDVGAYSSRSGIITSDQPLNVVVSESISSGGSAYNVTALTSANLYSPLALNGAFGGFTTNIIVFNAGGATSSGQVQFYDANGNLAASQPFNVAAHASQTLSQAGLSGLSNNQSYWAKISASNATDALTAQVIEFGPHNFAATFNASIPAQADTNLYAPAAFNGLYGYVTGMGFANPNSVATSVTVTYYDGNGNNVGSQTVPIAANGNASLYQGAIGTSPNVASAVVSSNQPIVMTVNELGPNNVSGTYLGIASGSTSVALPVVANGFAGFVTGATILNTGSSTANLTLTYLDGSGNPVGNVQTASLAPNASYALYQGASSQGLPGNYFGTALITSSQPIIVTTNALQNGTGLFYTYTEPGK